jgi:hypothetical protein
MPVEEINYVSWGFTVFTYKTIWHHNLEDVIVNMEFACDVIVLLVNFILLEI